MSDRFHPISMEQLTDWVFTELEEKDSLFNVPRSAFFVPSPDHRFRLEMYGVELDTPFGVAAGPATQMAQNIIVSWLVGARFIELKTVQTLDELDVNKPCIDLEDEGDAVEGAEGETVEGADGEATPPPATPPAPGPETPAAPAPGISARSRCRYSTLWNRARSFSAMARQSLEMSVAYTVAKLGARRPSARPTPDPISAATRSGPLNRSI